MSSRTFVDRHAVITRPDSEPVVVAPTPDFYRWSFASMWTPGPFEGKPTAAYYYVTDTDRAGRLNGRKNTAGFQLPDLWVISIHEVFPGHFLHYQHLRSVESKVRKSILFSPASCVEGWAHYCEQMMMEVGFRRDDQALRLGQLAEALIRLVRFIVSIRLHAEDMSVEQGVRISGKRATSKKEVPDAKRSGDLRPDISCLCGGEAHAVEASPRLSGAAARAGRNFHCASFTTHCSAMGPGRWRCTVN